MERTGFVQFQRRFFHFGEVRAVACFVAERPHENAGVVAVAKHHALHFIHNCVRPNRVAPGNALAAHAVAFHIAFVHHIEPVFVAKLIEKRVVGVVRSANGIDICAFHQIEILIIALFRHRPAVVGVKVVAVHAAKKHRLPVKENLLADDLHFAETEANRLISLFAVCVQSQKQRVKHRCFRRPFLRIFHGFAQIHRRAAVRRGGKFQIAELTLFAVGVHDFRGDFGGLFGVFIVMYRDFDVCVAVRVSVVQIRRHEEIAKADFFFTIEEHFAVNAAKPPHVLVFNVSRVAVTINLDANQVFAALNEFRHVEFVGCHRVLRIADKFPVDVKLHCGFDCAEVQENFFALKILRQGKYAAVMPDFLHVVVNRRDFAFASRNRAGECARVIIGNASGLFRLPDGRHADSPPSRIVKVRIIKIGRFAF